MRVYLDSNVLIDFLANRAPFASPAETVWKAIERGDLLGSVCAGSFDNLYFILRRSIAAPKVKAALRRLCTFFSLVAVDTQIVDQALSSSIKDFEDAIQYHCWIRSKADYLLTRNLADFPRNKNIITPHAFVNA